MPPASASSPNSNRRPKASERSVGIDRKRRASPAALLPGFSGGRGQKRRPPQNRRTTGTIHAAKPTRAYRAAESDAPNPPTQFRGETASPVVSEKRFGSLGS